MLRWKTRFVPVLVVLTVVGAAALNATIGFFFLNLGW